MTYNKTTSKTVDGERISYGIVYGNEKIVFIKVGAYGRIRGKYVEMARRVHERLGATVICASNPYIEHGHHEADKAMIAKIVSEMGFLEYQIHLFGTSDGAYHNIELAQSIPETVRLLGVNTSSKSGEDLTQKFKSLAQINKTLVYGTKDDEYSYVARFKQAKIENLEILTIEGANHEFSGMLEEYISLIDLL